MFRKHLLISLCFMFLLPSACIFKRGHFSQNADLEATVAKLVQCEKELENSARNITQLMRDQKQHLQQIHKLKLDNRACTKGQDLTPSQLEAQNRQARHNELEKINANLSNKIKNLKIEIKKRDSIIEIQEDVIRVLDDTKKTIETSLKEQIAKKLFEIETTRNRLRMVIQDTILFDPGSMMINARGKKVLRKIAASVKENPDQHIRVEGHTDNHPPKNGPSSNWELSAARAIVVIQFLESIGLDPSKLSAVAYGANRPVATNETESGRLQNRRIELVLYYTN